jgi:hypothetical protein
MFVLGRQRRSMVIQDELVIAIVLLVTWGLATAAMVLD